MSAHLYPTNSYSPKWGLFLMRKIDDGDSININDLINEFTCDVLNLDSDDIDDTEYQLVTSQYAYIKFGLILEKIRNRAWWTKCREKFADFKAFCQTKININIWQAANAIKSAQVAVRLAYLGFTELPRNASQALKLSELSIERLGEVWGNILAKCQGHKITALAIKQEISPATRNAIETLRLPVAVMDALRRQAIERGLSLNEYLGQLADEQPEPSEAVDPTQVEVDPELAIVLDDLDLKFAAIAEPKPKKVFRETIKLLDHIIDLLTSPYREYYLS
jgi:hypothetical protein